MFECRFRTDNAAFEDARETEVCRILRDIADRIERGEIGFFKTIRDINGNDIGAFKLHDEE